MAFDSLINGPFLGTSRNPWSYQKVEQYDRDTDTAWLTLEEITQQLNLFDDESQDGYLTTLELATRMAIEDYLGMSILPTSYKVYYGATNNMIGAQTYLDLPEVSQNNGGAGVTINSVGYYNNSTPPNYAVLSPSAYYYDLTGNRVVVDSFPNNVSNYMTNPIIVDYTLNANPIGAYPVIKHAGLLLLTHLYNNRSDTVLANIGLKEIPFGVSQLLRPYKPLVL
jgi:hypothetical protein